MDVSIMLIEDLKREMSLPLKSTDFYGKALRLCIEWRRNEENEKAFLCRIGVLKEFVDEFLPIANYCNLSFHRTHPNAVITHVIGSQNYDASVETEDDFSVKFLEVTCLEDVREHNSRKEMANTGIGNISWKKQQAYSLAETRLRDKCGKAYPSMTNLIIYNKFSDTSLTADLAIFLKNIKSNINCNFSSVFVLDNKVCLEI